MFLVFRENLYLMVMVLVHMMKLQIVLFVLLVHSQTKNYFISAGELLLTKIQTAIIMVPVHAHSVEVASINLIIKVPVVLLVLAVDIYRLVRLCRIIYPCHNVWLVILVNIHPITEIIDVIFVVQAIIKIKMECHHVNIVILATIQIKI